MLQHQQKTDADMTETEQGRVCVFGGDAVVVRTITAPARNCMWAGAEVRTGSILKIKAVTWY